MGTATKMLYGAILIVLLLAGTYYLVKQNEAKGEEGARTDEGLVYLNEVYGYEFTHASMLSFVELSPEYQTLEDPARTEPNELVQIAVAEAELDADFASLEEFARDRARIFCAADGPGGSMHCEAPTRSEAFTTATGMRGEVFYLEFVHETFADGKPGTRTTREAGPFYAFNISTDAPGSGYRALIVRPADFFSEGESYELSAAAANELVNTLYIY